jgi:hypothetical protein
VLETTVVVENQGNTTAAYSLNLDLDQPPEGFLFQVMVYRTYSTPSVEGCQLVNSVQQEQLVNELTPDVNGGLLNPEATTFYVPPGDNVVVTVRVVPDPNATVPGNPATINTLDTLQLSQAVAPQAVDTVSVAAGETQPKPVVVVSPTVPLLSINAVTLADAMVSSSYSQTLTKTGGDGSPVIWSRAPGGALPTGLSLSPAGQISGTALAQGTFNFNVRAQDNVQVTERAFSINVLPGGAGALFTETVINDDSDILNDGSLSVANTNNLGSAASAQTVNGVAFATDQSGLIGAWGPGGGDFSTDSFSAPLDALLSNLQFSGTLGTVTLRLGGLNIGQTYRLQLLFSNDVNLTGNNVAISVQGDSYVLDDWQPNAINLRVEFVASSTSVDVTFQPGPSFVPGTFPADEPGRAVLNAYALHSAPFVSGPVVDQQQPSIDQAAGGLGIFQQPTTGGAGQSLVQTVTAGITGSLDAVSLPVQCASGDLVVRIQGLNVSGTPNGVVLASQVVNGMSYPQFGANPPTLRQIAFTSPASFNVGDQFAIVIESQGSCDMFKGPVGNPYAGGQGYYDSRPPSALQPLINDGGRDDLPFQTLVTPGAGPLVTGATLGTPTFGGFTVQIGGTGINYAFDINNSGPELSPFVVVQGWVDQPGASRAAGGAQVSCGAGTGVLPNGTCSYSGGLSTNNTAAAGFGTLTPGPATGRIELKFGGIVIDTITVPITLAPIATTTWRADFDLSSGAVGPYVCLRNQYEWNPTGTVNLTVQVFDAFSNALVGQESYPNSANGNLGDEIFLSGTALPSGQGYMLVTYELPVILNSLSVEGRTGQCIGGGVTGFFNAQLTPQP